MRQAVLVAFALAGCGFTAKPGAGGGTADGAPDAPSTTADAPMIDAAVDAPVDAPMIDAPPDAPPVWTTVETLMVPCGGTVLTSTFVLQLNTMYRLRATGECTVNQGNGSRADAEYFGYNVGQTYDTYNGVDSGIAVDDTTPGSTKNPRWGTFSAQHSYEVMWPGTGAAIQARYHDSAYNNNSGSLTLQIQALQ